jgi:hypothetical protein
MSHEGKWNTLNFFSNGLLLQCCLYLWFITRFVQLPICIVCVFADYTRTFQKKIAILLQFFHATNCWHVCGCAPSILVGECDKCILQNEDHVGWCVHLKIVLTQST